MKMTIKVMAATALLLSSGVALAESKIVDAIDVVRFCFGDVKSLCSDQINGGEGLKA